MGGLIVYRGDMVKEKTNAMRLLDQLNIDYKGIAYDPRDGRVDGMSVVAKINQDPDRVFKTLVTKGTSGSIYVFIIPVNGELDFKKAAKTAVEKKIHMINVKDIASYTGYIRGGCSPIGMKRGYPSFLDKSADELDYIIVSGGKIGVQIQLNPEDLLGITKGKLADLIK